MKGNFKITWPRTWKSMAINYDLPLNSSIQSYKDGDENITDAHFPSNKSGITRIDVGLIKYEIYPSGMLNPPSNYVWRYPAGTNYLGLYNGNTAMVERGLRHVDAKELLSLGLEYPKMIAYRTVWGLAQTWVGKTSRSNDIPYIWVPVVRGDGENLYAHLTWTPTDHEAHTVLAYIAVVKE